MYTTLHIHNQSEDAYIGMFIFIYYILFTHTDVSKYYYIIYILATN